MTAAEWNAQLDASYDEGLIDADDHRRLWRLPDAALEDVITNPCGAWPPDWVLALAIEVKASRS